MQHWSRDPEIAAEADQIRNQWRSPDTSGPVVERPAPPKPIAKRKVVSDGVRQPFRGPVRPPIAFAAGS